MLNIDNQENRPITVLGEHFIDIGIMRFEGRTGCVPA